MKITITRNHKGKSCQIGRLKVLDDNYNVLFECDTLENKESGYESGKDLAIPADNYLIDWRVSPKFSGTLGEIMGNFKQEPLIVIFNARCSKTRAILIHWGNTDKDTEGCILLGQRNGDNAISQSRATCKSFYKLMKKYSDLSNWQLEIRDEF